MYVLCRHPYIFNQWRALATCCPAGDTRMYVHMEAELAKYQVNSQTSRLCSVALIISVRMYQTPEAGQHGP
jgi:hypothetical protein